MKLFYLLSYGVIHLCFGNSFQQGFKTDTKKIIMKKMNDVQKIADRPRVAPALTKTKNVDVQENKYEVTKDNNYVYYYGDNDDGDYYYYYDDDDDETTGDDDNQDYYQYYDDNYYEYHDKVPVKNHEEYYYYYDKK